jgi:ABC-type multidrug transport system permease subunit
MARLSEAAAMSGKGSRAAVDIVGLPLYNATGGYGTYLIPAVLMVILFQTLLMAVSVRLGTDYTERYRRWLHLISVPTWHSAARLVTARRLVYVSVYAVMAFFLVGLVPWLFDLPHESGPLTLAVLMGEYLVASAAFALACAPLFRDPEGPLVYIAFFSVGYLFLSGISYPLELMPAGWRIVRLFFPVCPATLAYVETATMGATLQDISAHLLLLSVQAKVYISVAVFGHFRLLKRGFHYGILKNNDEKQINS